MNEELLSQVQVLFDNSYRESTNSASARHFFSPARINLIGEHIDYCGGLVFPAAIQYGTVIIARLNNLGVIRVRSVNEPDFVEFDSVGNLLRDKPLHWSDYVKGVFVEYFKLGAKIDGLDVAIGGNIPGSGLSSSASLEVGIAIMIEAFSGYANSRDYFVNRQALSRLTQRAENDFVGVNCGVMDQGAIALGKKDHAMLMDCKDLSIDYFPLELGSYNFLIIDSCKKRRLGDSAYNERCEEVAIALAILQPVFEIDTLCDLPIDLINDALGCLSDLKLEMRVRHVVSEQNRVREAAVKLENGDIKGFGMLLSQSHLSLQLDYEVTGLELDTLIGLAQEQPGVLGARMMGAGFGGCGIALIEAERVEDFSAVVGEGYKSVIGYYPKFYPVQISAGAEEIRRNSSE